MTRKYLDHNTYLKNKYGFKVWKLPLDMGLICPNRIDGNEGCYFCSGKTYLPEYLLEYSQENSNENFNEKYNQQSTNKTSLLNETSSSIEDFQQKNQKYSKKALQQISIEEQLEKGKQFFSKRLGVTHFIGYFQANTNTYGDIDFLINNFKKVLEKDYIVELAISTRPDYIYREIVEKINLLQKEYNKDIWIELGLQSTDDKILKFINRNHTYEDFKNATRLIKSISNKALKITVHMIAGLPYEKPENILENFKKLYNENSIDGIKIRPLDIEKETEIYNIYQKNPEIFYKFSPEEYAKLISEIIKITPENIVIMRFANYKTLINNENKTLNKSLIVNMVDKLL